MIRLVAVCVSNDPSLSLPLSIPFINHVDMSPIPPRRTIARVRYVAEQRNAAMREAMLHRPTHVLMVDGDYLLNGQNREMFSTFVRAYDDLGIILGAGNYIVWNTVIGQRIIHFCDVGTTPEAADSVYGTEGKTAGRIRVQAVGSVYIFPVGAWLTNGYGTREDFFWPEHHQLCRDYPCYISFDHKFWKPPLEITRAKRVRVLAGALRRSLIGI